MDKQKIPILFYNSDGERLVIGSAELDGNELVGTITNTSFKKVIAPEFPVGSLSIAVEPPIFVEEDNDA